jgi:5-methylcytosine-specific restriction endonuclease McrA
MRHFLSSESGMNDEQAANEAALADHLRTTPSVGAKMFATYADKYSDWVARGTPPSPSLPTHWVWKKRNPATPLVQAMAAAQGGACFLCGEPLRFDADGPQQPTFEHVVPRSRGGGNSKNRLIAHRSCNLRKGSRMPNGCELILLDAVNARLYA